MPKSLDNSELLFAVKPAGISSHRPSEDHQGFVEWLSPKYHCDLKICHRLDKETSGAMVFGKNKEAAAQLTKLFTNHQVEKEYLFVSHKKSKFNNWIVCEDKSKGTLLQECPWEEEGVGYQSFTEIIRISSEGPVYLYKAKPRTGKTHQIRKHATHSGVPILGDFEYGGKAFPRLMLHCLSLKFEFNNEAQFFTAPASRIFQDLTLCSRESLSRWVVAVERREILFPEKFDDVECFRLTHSETNNLRVEKVGDKVILGWWKSEPPTDVEKKEIKELMEILGIKHWIFQWRPGAQNSQSTEVILQSPDFVDTEWEFRENGVKYQASLKRGQNFGLFLDQRERRRWVRDKANQRSVLNLFAFSCGFSLNAALGGAQKVVSVDIFEKYLEWGKENFRINGLDPAAASYEWRKMDSLDYLKYARKKELTFDLIVCDPPSFSRNKRSKKVFRVERDFKELIDLCLACLNPGGSLLFSTNYEKWDLGRWQQELFTLGENRDLKPLRTSDSQWDYEWQKKEANLKAFFMEKA